MEPTSSARAEGQSWHESSSKLLVSILVGPYELIFTTLVNFTVSFNWIINANTQSEDFYYFYQKKKRRRKNKLKTVAGGSGKAFSVHLTNPVMLRFVFVKEPSQAQWELFPPAEKTQSEEASVRRKAKLPLWSTYFHRSQHPKRGKWQKIWKASLKHCTQSQGSKVRKERFELL